MSKINWKMLGLFGAVLFVSLVVVFLATQNRETRETEKVPEGKRSLAHQLAVSNAGKYVSADHETVKEFAELLTSLEEGTTSSKERIKNLSIESVTELEENYDVEVKLLEFMERANEMVNETDQTLSYAEISTKVKVILSQEKSEA